jgi:hypothetical protein
VCTISLLILFTSNEDMKEEMVSLSNVNIEKLMASTKLHLQELGLQIIHEDKSENYWSTKAHKGGKIAAVTGSIRDVEILVTGSENRHELVLRTGAWGRDIAIPALLTAAFSPAGGAAVAVAEAYRAHKFEKNFWEWLNGQVAGLGNNATVSAPKIVNPQP